MLTRPTPKEIALLNKLNQLPVSIRKPVQLRRVDCSWLQAVCWLRTVKRGDRRYTMACDAREGSLYVSVRASRRRASGRV